MEYIEEPQESTTLSREVIDLCLRFSDEDEAMSVLFTDGTSNYRTFDIIGAIFKPSGKTAVDAEGNKVSVMTSVKGFHVNVRVMPDEDIAAIEPFAITPTNPVRVWA